MTAWAEGVFDNDDALNFADRLDMAPDWATVADALQRALRADCLDAMDAAEALAAAAFVAAAHSGEHDLVPPRYVVLLKGMGPVGAGLRVNATEAVGRVASDSELAELWEGGDASGWLETLSAIGARLA